LLHKVKKNGLISTKSQGSFQLPKSTRLYQYFSSFSHQFDMGKITCREKNIGQNDLSSISEKFTGGSIEKKV
jgi:hypothetical protein